MLRFQALSATVLGFGILSMGMGCAQQADDLDMTDEADLVDPAPAPLGGIPGSGTMNNLPPPDFQYNKWTGFNSATHYLGTFSGGRWWIAGNPWNTMLLGSAGGRNFIKYAARCAMPTSITLFAYVGTTQYSFPGLGLLTTTPSWLSSGLSVERAEDLYSCLLAHLNSKGVEVPINVSGPNVVNDPGSDSSFTWKEALWATKIIQTGQDAYFEFYVWPMDSLMGCEDFVPQLKDRVCGTYSGDCGLTVRGDRDTACTETAAGWYCNDLAGHALPAIETKLKETSVDTMYDNCTL